ncbi:MAG: hypothetical protein M3386_00505 [Actinomycetota bacterium]|nr:hypothetical protein [Actinomycetota bacterium]
MEDSTRLWHVTVTVAGAAQNAEAVREAMLRLADERPFLHALRYGTDRAEIRYWEEAFDMLDAASLALRVWNEHRHSAGLPCWEVVGLEVLERDAFNRRTDDRAPAIGAHQPTPQPF